MKIIICGAGRVGASLVENIALQPGIEVTLIDTDPKPLSRLRTYLDIQTIQGSANNPDTLEQANVQLCDLFIAVTSSDAVNLVACSLAYHLFGSRAQLARVVDPKLQKAGMGKWMPETVDSDQISSFVPPTTTFINPISTVVNHIRHLVENPFLTDTFHFSSGLLTLFHFRISTDTSLLNRPASYLQTLAEGLESQGKPVPLDVPPLEGLEAQVVAIFRQGRFMKARPWTLLESGDEAYILTKTHLVKKLGHKLRPHQRYYRSIFIQGGGRVGLGLCQALEGQYNTKLLEANQRRCERAHDLLEQTPVIQGKATDRKILIEEGIKQTDLFCSLTGEDELNLLSCSLAKSLGARHTFSLIQNLDYHDLISRYPLPIDTPLSPQLISLSSILSHINKNSAIRRVYTLRDAGSEALELTLDESSWLVGKKVEQCPLPYDAIIGAVSRRTSQGRMTTVANGSTALEARDRLVLFLPHADRQNELASYLTSPEQEPLSL